MFTMNVDMRTRPAALAPCQEAHARPPGERMKLVAALPGLAVRHLHGNRWSDWSDEPKVLDDVTRQLPLA